ncbi:SMI1/KNR4 family protein [Chryseobacterium balustinum]|uniref:SMI1 / KNR4 family (SUKH-1) n=2 Tax=Chryseobacterium balustinum TaxID=246 RepID=A0ABY1L3V5_9FLAO|nr:SMI1/KNR4 family protein [Chryseobacterium balustinum]SKB40998.1 SMI1 / KNR4 family (SUKH-1) [Chryseobacterium balustinum]
MSLINTILSKYKWIKRAEMLDFNFKTIEDKIGFDLPQDYKDYSIEYDENEDFIGKEFVRLWSLENLIDWNTDYQILENLPNTIAIGDNGNGEFIGIHFIENSNYKIILSTYIDLDPEYNIEIGKSFTDFIEKLNKGKTWFNEK